MAIDTNTIVDICTRLYKGEPVGTYSKSNASDAIREAVLKANNNKTTFSLKDIINGDCKELFSVIGEIITATSDIELSSNSFVQSLVDYRNLKKGDKNEFIIKDPSTLYVSRVADGTQGLLRQRISGATKLSIETHLEGVKTYDELSRFLAGRVDAVEFTELMSRSMTRKKFESILKAFVGIATTNPSNYFVTSGSYSADTLLKICDKVEAETGKTPIIMGTKQALRNITYDTTIVSDLAKNDIYNMGILGKFYGYNCVAIPQTLKRDKENFYLPTNVLYIIGVDDKPVKFVTEGEALIATSNITQNCDLTQDFLTIENFGVGVVVAGKSNGIYTIS